MTHYSDHKVLSIAEVSRVKIYQELNGQSLEINHTIHSFDRLLILARSVDTTTLSNDNNNNKAKHQHLTTIIHLASYNGVSRKKSFERWNSTMTLITENGWNRVSGSYYVLTLPFAGLIPFLTWPLVFLWLIKRVSSSLVKSDSETIRLLVWFNFPAANK